MPTDVSKLHPLNVRILKDIQKEWRIQGHFLTGFLERNSENRTEASNGDVILEAYAPAYAEELEHGVPASEIEINDTTLREMTEYVMKRMGYGGIKAQQVAYFILRKQQKEGKPTENSKQYSQTGIRTEAIDLTFGKNEDAYFNVMDEAISEEIDKVFFHEATEII